ncbi:MAG: hypothetical protein WBE77_08730 [Candidatus Cybelea sp.]|jgi:hypothetical protein
MKHSAIFALGSLAVAICLFATPVASTAQPAPAPTMVPMNKPDFSSLMFLVGTWKCMQSLRGKQRSDTATTTVSADGMWLVTQDTSPPFDQYRTVAINGTTYTGYDSTIKQWIQIGIDSGGGYGTSTSPGWQGNTITWTTKNLDGSSGTDVNTKHSDTMYTDSSSATDAQGKTTNVTVTCNKEGS